jgi:hypothetical protein
LASSPSAHPGLLEPLQEALLDAFRGVEGVYLTGGSALAGFYLGHRHSLDLDLFTPEADRLDELEARLKAWCDAHGVTLLPIRTFPGFRRFQAERPGESTLVDLVHEPVPQTVPLTDKPLHGGLRLDDLRDVVANKLGALLGRGETKDLVDLYFLSLEGFDPLAFLDAARQRDGGLDALTLAWVLQEMTPDLADVALVRPLEPEELDSFRLRLMDRLLALAWPGT